MVVMIRNRIGGDFCEDAFGRDGHGHASKSKEILYNKGSKLIESKSKLIEAYFNPGVKLKNV